MSDKKTLPTRAWIAILGGIFALFVLAAFLLGSAGGKKHVAKVYLDGEMICEIDLSSVNEAYDFTVECDDGYNTIAVRHGGICVSAADCGDGTCIKQGWLEGGLTPIVCMPHRLIIQLEDTLTVPGPDIGIDAVAG